MPSQRDPTTVQRTLAIHGLRYGVVLGLDAVSAGLSLYLAMLFRFEGRLPSDMRGALTWALPILVATRVSANIVSGLHRWSFRMSGLSEAVRLALTAVVASACFVLATYFLFHASLPRSVIALEFFFSTSLMAGYRFAPRLAAGWYVNQVRARQDGTLLTLIVGAGNAGDLLLRDLVRSADEHSYHVIGFIDDDARKIGTSIGGKPVLGSIEAMPALIDRFGVTKVLIAAPRMSASRIRTILSLCADKKAAFKIIPASFAIMDERITAAMLHDLSPEDLLPRDPVAFDVEEVHQLVRGRRVLVTGAGGSIGGEIARQVAAHEPSQLVLVDINENELYLLARRLQEKYPGLPVRAEVADIREFDRIRRLGERYRPEDVFHAAAHKHVPLMEDAPEEAIKNNVFGTQNVARMADACGAERFVFISTDKAVRPSSCMGASKRVAELVVRDLARTSKTRFTAVRFGNVLGSAGSVVPIFKEQIERGGPVTVTHPDCTRYFMTIPEAVGLVLLAGLGQYGELCILDMGEPIRIADLARHLVTMAGLVPNIDIPIVFTGLRPGEKLAEELLTEEEESTRVVRNKIQVASSPPPPVDLAEKLTELRRLADAADREGLLAALRSIVPTYVSPGAGAPVREGQDAGVVLPMRRSSS
jgi:FlaA1/EpsC-like NDP-sugar epimerase